MMRRMLALIVAMMSLITPAVAEEAEACTHARNTDSDFVCDVPACAPVDDDFFAEDLLVGDSITVSLDNRDVLPGLHIEAVIGLSPNAARRQHKFTYKGKKMTMVELCDEIQPKRLFVMLGSNGLDQMTSGTILGDYHLLLDELLDVLPDTEIYLLAVTPIRHAATKDKYPTFTHKRIVAFNTGLHELAQSHGVYYIDNYTPLMMENMADGEKDNFTGDGIHLTEQGAQKVADNLRTHVLTTIVEEELLDD